MKESQNYIVVYIPVDGDIRILSGREYSMMRITGLLTGVVVGYYDNPDMLLSIIEFVNGVPENRFLLYRLNGEIGHDGFFISDQHEGELIVYTELSGI